MKITTKQLRDMIKEVLSEIYEPGEMVPPEPRTGGSPSVQTKDIHQVAQLICPTVKANREKIVMGVELYNSIQGTSLNLGAVDNMFAEVRGSEGDLMKFYEDFLPLKKGGVISNIGFRTEGGKNVGVGFVCGKAAARSMGSLSGL